MLQLYFTLKHEGHFKPEVHLNNRKQAAAVNAVQGNNNCIFLESYETHKYSLWVKCKSLDVKADGMYNDCL
jgi:hypothetical protein